MSEIQFYLNEKKITVSEVSPTTTLLQFVRQERLTGTKEGCAEGDCGACTMVSAELDAQGNVKFKAVNSCILPVSLLDGKQLLSVESLAKDGNLHAVQQAFVEEHASQCGFCTPGFIMAGYALYQDRIQDANVKELTTTEIKDTYAGNLCRCTGYGPIIDATKKSCCQASATEIDQQLNTSIKQRLSELKSTDNKSMVYGEQNFIQPSSLEALKTALAENPDAILIAGATDIGLWITKQRKLLKTLITTANIPELQQLQVTQDKITIGAAVTYSQFMAATKETIPQLYAFLLRHSSVQIRNQGTIVGNIGNGSPIGDMPPALIALEASLTLSSAQGSREIALADYFIDYGKQDLQAGEFIESVTIPLAKLNAGATFQAYKVSKRPQQDISTSCAAFTMELADGIVASFQSGFGGMAAIPKGALKAEEFLIGKAWSLETVEAACQLIDKEFTPLSDHRGSAEYRSKVAGNLLRKFFYETSAEQPVAMQQVG